MYSNKQSNENTDAKQTALYMFRSFGNLTRPERRNPTLIEDADMVDLAGALRGALSEMSHSLSERLAVSSMSQRMLDTYPRTDSAS
jgi:hypothetical protein